MRPANTLNTGQFIGLPCRVQAAGAFSLGQWVADRGTAHMPAHLHEEAHFMFVPSTNYVTRAQGSSAFNGTFLIYNPPQTEHADRMPEPGAFFSVTVSSPSSLLEELDLPPEPAQIGRPRAHALVRSIARKSAGRPAQALELEALCTELLGEIASPGAERSRPAWLSRACDYIREHCREDLSLRSIADAAGVHPAHLVRSFRTHLGCTVADLVRACRVDIAAWHLTRSRQPLAGIALDCGFADQSHFTREFRRDVGLTPAAYRRATG